MVDLVQDAYPRTTQVLTDAQGNPAPAAIPNIATGYTQPFTASQSNLGTFPYYNSVNRLNDYEYFTRLFMGQHFEAFNVRINDLRYSKAYQKLRYVMVNFAGLISKVIADFLFSEPPSFGAIEGGDQEFLDALVHENNLHTQNYESALSNSYLGDALYKLRVGPRNPSDTEFTVIIEDITPAIYFPQVDGFNVRAEPQVKELAWTFKQGDKEYLRKEIHYSTYIENQIFLMEKNKIMGSVPFEQVGLQLPERVETGINRSLLIHVANWKTGNRHFGLSDYHDLDKLFYAYNSRMSAIDNILDKHSDPILMLPQGVLKEDGTVNKKALGVVEIQEGETQKPEYIVWDASLENAYKQTEKIVENIFMIGEISPDVLGMGQGQSDSGRALKLKIMRTIAKAARKKLYYDRALKEVLYTAMLLAKEHNLKVGGLSLKGDPYIPEIEWQDGLPIDNAEQVEIEAKRLDSGTTTTVDAIMRLDAIDEIEAKKKAKEIKEENKIELPTGLPKPFTPPNGNTDKTVPPDDKPTQTDGNLPKK